MAQRSYRQQKTTLLQIFDCFVANEALERNDGNRTKAAAELELDPANFRRLLRSVKKAKAREPSAKSA